MSSTTSRYTLVGNRNQLALIMSAVRAMKIDVRGASAVNEGNKSKVILTVFGEPSITDMIRTTCVLSSILCNVERV